MKLQIQKKLHILRTALAVLFVVGIFGVPFFAWKTMAATGSPSMLSYQGRLTNSSGDLLGGSGTSYYFKFSIWNNPTVGSGSRVWPAALPGAMTLNVVDGVFNVNIGDTANGYPDVLNYNFNDSDTVYLQVEVSANGVSYETLSPRQQITSSGYAINSNTLLGFSPSQLPTGNQIPVLNSGNLTLGGTNPQINATSTNALVLQGGAGTGDIRFFSAANKITSAGALTIAGSLTVGSYSSDPVGLANGSVFYNSTSHKFKIVENGTTKIVCNTTDAGCGAGGGSVAWSSIINPTGNLALTMNAYTSSFVWGTSTGSSNLLSLSDSANNTGTGTLLSLSTASGSSVTPLSVIASGVNALVVTSSGNVGIGTTTPTYNLSVVKSGGRAIVNAQADGDGGAFADYRLTRTGATAAEISTWAMSFRQNNGVGEAESLGFYFDKNSTSSAVMALQPDRSAAFYGNLGIGTTTPQQLLSVQNSATTTKDIFNLASSSGSSLFRVTALGNVGIGTATPASKLHVMNGVIHADSSGSNPAGFSGFIWGGTDTANPYISIGWPGSKTSTNYIKSSSGDNLSLEIGAATGGSGILQFMTSDTARIYIEKAGNVGIGTTSPARALHVVGATRIDVASANTTSFGVAFLEVTNPNNTTNNNASLGFRTNDSSGAIQTVSGIESVFTSHTAGAQSADLLFSTRNAGTFSEKVRITSAGNVGIGSSTPATPLVVNGNVTIGTRLLREVNNSSLSLIGGTAKGTSAHINLFGDDASPAGTAEFYSKQSGYFAFYNAPSAGTVTGAAELVRIANTGNVGIGTTTASAKLVVSGGNIEVTTGDYGGVNLYASSTGIHQSLTMNHPEGSAMQIFTGYTGGQADVNFWSGGNGTLRMTNNRIGVNTTIVGSTTAPIFSVGGGLHNANIIASAPAAQFSQNSAMTGDIIQALSNNIMRFTVTANGNVGIGTATPMQLLTVQNISTTTKDIFDLASSSGSSLLRVTALGNVGIGTTSPARRLHIVDNSAVPLRLERNSSSNGAGHLEIYNPNTTDGVAGSITFITDTTGSGAVTATSLATIRVLYNTHDNSTKAADLLFLTAGPSVTEKMRITSNGNVGIGTTTPAQLLSVAGDMRLTGVLFDSSNASGTLGMVLQTTGTTTQWVATSTLGITSGSGVSGGTNGFVARFTSATSLSTGALLDNGVVAGVNSTSSTYSFNIQGAAGVAPLNVASSSGTSLLTVLGNGNVGIGTTTPAGILEVKGSSASLFTRTTSGGSGQLSALQIGVSGNVSSAGTGSSILFFGDNSTASKQFMARISSIWDSGTAGSEAGALTFNVRPNSADVNATTEAMRISSNGNVGIGITSPGYVLDVYPTTATASDLFRVATSTGAGLYVKNSGNIGIGTSTPNASVYLTSSGVSAPTKFVIDNNPGGVGVGLGSVLSIQRNSSVASSTIEFFNNLDAGGFVLGMFGATNSFKIMDRSSNTNVVTIEDNAPANTLYMSVLGNIGIGTSAPSRLLHVYGSTNGSIASLVQNGTTGTSAVAAQILTTPDSGAQIALASGNYNQVLSWADRLLLLSETSSAGINLVARASSGDIRFTTGGDTTERMIIDSTGNVGIGTSTPRATLYIQGTSTAGTVNPFIVASSTGAQLLTVLPNGNVGIGTITPGSLLDVNGLATVRTSGPQTGGLQVLNQDGIRIVLISQRDTKSGDLYLYDSTGTQQVRLQSAGSTSFTGGSVGIGTTTPSQLFTVGNNNQFTVSSTGQVVLGNAGTYIALPNGDGTKLLLNGPAQSDAITKSTGSYLNLISSGPLSLYSNGTNQALTINTSGNVGIGTTAPGQTLVVSGSARVLGALYDSNNASGTLGMVLQTTGTTTQWVATSTLGITASLAGGSNGLVARWTSPSTISTGALIDNGTVAGVNATSSSYSFNIQGAPGIAPLNVSSSSGTSLLTVLGNGNVGIGTTSPQEKLEVNGNIQLTSNTSQVKFGTTAGDPYLQSVGASDLFVGSSHIAAEFGVWADTSAGGRTYGFRGFSGRLGLYANGTEYLSIGGGVNAGNVGIGTTVPTDILTVVGGDISLSRTQYLRFRSETSAAQSAGIGGSTSNDLVFYTNGLAEKMRITSGGNIGVGTSTPGQKLVVVSSGTNTAGMLVTGGSEIGVSANSAQIMLGADSTARGNIQYSYGTGFMYFDNTYNNDNGDIYFRTKTAGTPVNAMVIKGSGNVGIGTTTANTYKLSVAGSISIDADSAYRSGVNWLMGQDSGTNVLHIGSAIVANDIRFDSSSGAGLVMIKASGNVGIGTTTPVAVLDVNGASILRGNLTFGTNNTYDIGSLSGNNSPRTIYAAGAVRTSVGAIAIGPTTEFSIWKDSTPSKAAGMILSGNDLVLRTYDGATWTNNVVVQNSTGNVGIGTTTPAQLLSVAGNMRLTGSLFDSANASGTIGMVLQTTGTTTQWVATSSLGISGGSGVSGGTPGFVARFTSASGLSTGLLIDNGSVAGVNATSSNTTFNIQGSSGSNNALVVASSTGTALLTVAPSGAVSMSGGLMHFTNGTSNTINFNTAGVAAPGASSAGAKLILYGTGNGVMQATDYALGVEGSNVWFNTNSGFKFYTNSAFHTALSSTLFTTTGSGSFSGGYILLNNGTKNAIGFSNGVGVPTTNSLGLKLNLTSASDNMAVTDQSIGQESGSILWMNAGSGIKLYVSAQPRVTLDANGNLGIGTTSPIGTLAVMGTSTQPATSLFVVASSSGSQVFTILANGNVGIGTTAPGQTLVVSGSARVLGALYDSNNASGTLGMVLQTTGTTTQWVATSTLGITASLAGGSNGLVARWTSPSTISTGALIDNGTVAGVNATSSTVNFLVQGTGSNSAFQINSSTGTNLFTVTPYGSVGIATSVPAATFSVRSIAGAPAFMVASSSGAQTLSVLANGQLFYQNSDATFMISGSVADVGLLAIKFRNHSDVNLEKVAIFSNSIGAYGRADLMLASRITNDTNPVTTADARLTVSGTTGYVGIGTTTPADMLSVYGNIALTGSNSAIYTNGSTDLYVRSGSGRKIQFGSNNTDGQMVLSGGNVGIGVTAPRQTLEVRGTTPVVLISTNSDDSGTAWLKFANHTDVNIAGKAGIYTTPDGNGYGRQNMSFALRSISDFATVTNGDIKMTIQNNGSVGIGTVTPIATLAVSGTTTIPNTPLFVLASSTGAQLFVVNPSGNVGIGTTTQSQKLVVVGDARITGALFDSSNASGTLGMVLQTTGTTTRWVATSTLGITGSGGSVSGGAPGVVARFISDTALATGVFYDNGIVAGVNATSTYSFHVQGTGAHDPFTVTSSTGVSLFSINQNGNIGVGTATPSDLLNVYSTVSGTGITLESTANSQFTIKRAGTARLTLNSFGSIGTVGGSSNGLKLCGGSSTCQDMFIDSAGNVGIGTTIPSATLFVQGTTTVNPFVVASSTGASLVIITSVGNMGIGTTAPGSLLDIASSASGSNVDLFRIISNVGAGGNVKFRVDSDGDVFSDGTNNLGGGADIAENYPVLDTFLEAGDVVALAVSTTAVISTESQDNQVIENIAGIVRATSTTQNVLGIIATKPGVLMSSNLLNSKPVALAGRVPVKVSLENGPIAVGDFLVVSKIYPGYAAKAVYSGNVIGQALQDVSATTATSTVTAFVKSSWQNINNTFVLEDNGGQLLGQVGTTTASGNSMRINQKGTGDILQLQVLGENKIVFGNLGTLSILASTTIATTTQLSVSNGTTTMFSINARGDIRTKGVIIVEDDSFAGSVATDASGQAEVTFTNHLGTGKPVVQLTAESENPVFAQVLSWRKDTAGNYTGFVMKTFSIDGSAISAVVHYTVVGKQDAYTTYGEVVLQVVSSPNPGQGEPNNPPPTEQDSGPSDHNDDAGQVAGDSTETQGETGEVAP